MLQDGFYTVTELRNKLSVESRTIRKWVERGKIPSKYHRNVDGTGRGGKRLEIHIEGLPKKHRAEFLLHRAREQGADLTVKQFEMDRIKALPAWQQKKTMPYYSIIQKAEQLGLKGQLLKEALDQ